MNRTLHGDRLEKNARITDCLPDRSSPEPSLITPAPKTPMPFWRMWARVLVRRPGASLAAMYWQLTRRKVRARSRLAQAAAALPLGYELWMRQAEDPARLAALAETRPRQWLRRPKISVLVNAASATAPEIEATTASVHDQLYTDWRLRILPQQPNSAGAPHEGAPSTRENNPTALEEAIRSIEEDYILFLPAGDLLAPSALLRIAEAVQSGGGTAIIYGDHDEIAVNGRRRNPWFKPAWNEEMFFALDYLSPAVTMSAELARTAIERSEVPIETEDQVLLTATSLAGDRILHIPHIIGHARSRREGNPHGRLRALEHRLKGTRASVGLGPFGTFKITWPLPEKPPLVTIIVPTRDKLELLAPCVETLLERTSYRPFELLVVDNQSSEQGTKDYLKTLGEHPQIRVLHYDRSYNFSAINNFAAGQAEGSYLCMLNNDTEVVDPNWLTELMRYAVRPEIGAVGAKLLYPDRRIQHAGVVVGLGGAAGHAHRFDSADERGYFCEAHVARFVSAVTAACLVVEKRKFETVGGLDEDGFPVAFNDVDFCLKLQSAGWRNVYTPHAVLLHHESKSRGKDHAPANLDRFTREHSLLQQRWQTETYEDPYHNPNLDRRSERYIVDL